MLSTGENKIFSTLEKPIKTTKELSQFNQIVYSKPNQVFGGNNPKRLSYLYTPLEFESLKLFNGFFEERKVYHEFPIKVKDEIGKTHNYHLDFYDTITQSNIEISPNFHKSYKIVVDSDKRRERLLKKLNIKVYHIRANNVKEKTLKSQIKKTINIIKKKRIPKTILDYYF